MNDYTEINSKAIDKWNKEGWQWGGAITHEVYVNAQNGQWDVVLTPQKTVPHEWFSPFIKRDSQSDRLDGVKLLGLASGGGQQMPIFSALGADCTVLDYSDSQLESEKAVSEREGYSINIVKADMTQRLPFNDEVFDIIFHPVSNCYIENVLHVWNECYRVLKKGGVLLSGVSNAINFLVEDSQPNLIVNRLPYNPLKDRELYNRSLENDGCLLFSHSLEEQLGGQLKAGFTLTDLYEDTDNDGIGRFAPNFIATRAVKN